MSKKKAFIFDTNFIIQHPDLNVALDKLKDQYTLYVSQVSIDERIAQQCRELRQTFDEAKKCEVKFIHFASIKYKKTFEEECEYYQSGIQAKYDNYFGDHVIPLAKTGDTLSAVIERADKRLPPFSDAKGASDKGFKDCLLWLSILDYFKKNGEDEVIFVTDDKSAFLHNTDVLESEFKRVTDKAIHIHPNTYYKELIKTPAEITEEVVEEPEAKDLPNLETLRVEIEEAVESLRGIDYENYYGDPMWSSTFSTSIPFDKEYVKAFFGGLRTDIQNHIFERTVPATKVLDLDGRVANGEAEIPMHCLENVLRLYQAVLKNYSQYSDQFFEAAAKVLNKNYRVPPIEFLSLDDDDTQLPF